MDFIKKEFIKGLRTGYHPLDRAISFPVIHVGSIRSIERLEEVLEPAWYGIIFDFVLFRKVSQAEIVGE